MATDRYILDAGIPALYLSGNNSVKKYFDRISDESALGYMCEVNMAEFMYNYARKYGWQAAEVKVRLIRQSNIRLPVIDELITSHAARLKLEHENLFSLGDCYLLATAKVVDATILTTESRLREYKGLKVLFFPLN